MIRARSILWFCIFLLAPFIVSGQSFVKLKDGTVIKGSVEYSSKIFKAPKIIVNDTTSFSLGDVQAYQTLEGYFRRVDIGNGEYFARRIEKGNVDLFTRTVQHMGGSWMPIGPNGTMVYSGPMFNSSQVEYFSKNDDPLQRANARNLKRALADNPVSMRYLKKRNGLTVVQVIGIVAGLSMSAVSIASQADKDELNLTVPMVGLVITGGSSWIPHYAKKDLTKKAIRSYNHPAMHN